MSRKNKRKNTAKEVATVTRRETNAMNLWTQTTQKSYMDRGVKNPESSQLRGFAALCKLSQEELKVRLLSELGIRGLNATVGDGFIYVKGEYPIMLTAHMDTVHKQLIKDWYVYTETDGTHIVSSPQGIGGDDRCGIYMILELLDRLVPKGIVPYILFCEDEEIGGVGSDKFLRHTELHKGIDELLYMIELDRANAKDAVYYDCANYDFIKFIEEITGYKENWGSFSDISNLAPFFGVAAVNLSCGYYRAHSVEEYVVMEEMYETIDAVEKLFKAEQIAFIYEEELALPYYNSGYGSSRYGWYDDDDYYFGQSLYATDKSQKQTTYIEVMYRDKNGKQCIWSSQGEKNEDELLCEFFVMNKEVCYNDIMDYDVWHY